MTLLVENKSPEADGVGLEGIVVRCEDEVIKLTSCPFHPNLHLANMVQYDKMMTM